MRAMLEWRPTQDQGGKIANPLIRPSGTFSRKGEKGDRVEGVIVLQNLEKTPETPGLHRNPAILCS